MVVLRSNFSDLMLPTLFAVFNTAYGEEPMLGPGKIFSIKGSSRQTEYLKGHAGIGQLGVVAEAAEIPLTDPTDGYKSTFTHKKYAKGIPLSQEAMDDELYGQFTDDIADLARAARATVEQACADILNAATTALSGAPNSEALVADSHTNAGNGATQANKTTSALSDATLKAGITAMRKFTDDNGNPAPSRPRMLLVPPDLEWTAKTILQSAGQSGTADNDTNVIQNSLEPVVWEYLSDTNNWFLIAPNRGLEFFWRQEPVFYNDLDASTLVRSYYTYERFSVGYSDWRAVYGGIV